MSNMNNPDTDAGDEAGKDDVPAVAASTQHDPKFWMIISAMIVIAAALYLGYWAGQSEWGVPEESPDEVPNITSQSDADQGTDNIVQGIDEVSDTLEDLEEIVE